jgi:5'-3' exonuclease
MPLTDKDLLIDADRIVYAVGFACQKTVYTLGSLHFNTKTEVKEYMEANPELVAEMFGQELVLEPVANCLHSVKLMLDAIVRITTGKYHIFLGGKGNFRLKIDPQYKANRIDSPKPVYYQDIRDYMVKFWGAEIVEGMEADDIVAMLQTEDTVIVSGDKDLLQVPGYHYNPQKPDLGVYKVGVAESARNFYTQMLAGDATDNIKGLGAVPEEIIQEYELHHSSRKGCGLVSASRLLENCMTAAEMHQRVLDVYTVKHGGDNEKAFADFLQQGKLLWLCRSLEPETGAPEQWDGMVHPSYIEADTGSCDLCSADNGGVCMGGLLASV